jgi:hypothetical protein
MRQVQRGFPGCTDHGQRQVLGNGLIDLDHDPWRLTLLTPLHVAVASDYAKIVRVLLENGADVNCSACLWEETRPFSGYGTPKCVTLILTVILHVAGGKPSTLKFQDSCALKRSIPWLCHFAGNGADIALTWFMQLAAGIGKHQPLLIFQIGESRYFVGGLQPDLSTHYIGGNAG